MFICNCNALQEVLGTVSLPLSAMTALCTNEDEHVSRSCVRWLGQRLGDYVSKVDQNICKVAEMVDSIVHGYSREKWMTSHLKFGTLVCTVIKKTVQCQLCKKYLSWQGSMSMRLMH